MKIVHVFLAGPMNDGWTYQENLLTKYHRRLGHDVTFITTQTMFDKNGKIVNNVNSNYINQDGVKVLRLPIKNKPVYYRFCKYAGLYESLIVEDPDIIFFHCFQCRDASTIARYARKHKVVIYTDNHADYSNSAKNLLSKYILHKIIWKHYARKLLPYVKKYYGVLPIRVDFLTDMYAIPKEKCELLVLGADDEMVQKANKPFIREMIRSKYSIREEDFLIVTGGKINSNRQESLNLMRAIAETDRDNVKLLVFGSVSEELNSEFNQLLNYRQIVYIGWVDTETTYKIFAASDLVVFPGLHSVMWEQAVAQGVPCVLRDLQGLHHYDLGGNVVFLSDTSKNGQKRIISQIIDSPNEYEHMKRVAREQGMAYFSYNEIAQRSIEETL